MNPTLATSYLQELESEYRATRHCIERIPESLFHYKPHPKSMELGYLSALVAAIPLWVTHMVQHGEIDFVTFPKFMPGNTEELVSYFEDNFESAKASLSGITDDAILDEAFSLKANGELIYTGKKGQNIMNALNHWVHHRGQLTVYMRLNNIDVPSIYGPSADDRSF